MDDQTKQFYRDIRTLKDGFIKDIGDLAIKYGIDIVPLSFDDIFKIWNPGIEKILDKDFKRKIERKVKRMNKKLNPFYRAFRKLFGK